MKALIKRIDGKMLVITYDFIIDDVIISHSGSKHIVFKVDGDFVYTDKGGVGKWNKYMFYKKLGEVSSEATFVEDGKEYEVSIEPYRTYRDSGKMTLTGQHEQELYTKMVAYVKCPTCNHYH